MYLVFACTGAVARNHIGGGANMTGETLLIVIMLTGLVLSGCIEHDIQTDNNTTDACMNATNATANVSEDADGQSVSIPLEKPRFIEDQ